MVQLMLCHIIDFSTCILKIWEENVEIFTVLATRLIVLCVNTFRCVVNAPGHLMDLNFSFDHNSLIGRFQGTLRRDLIEDSFLFEAD